VRHDHCQQPARRAVGRRPVRREQGPVITVSFWVIKVLTTGMGETTSDFLVHRFNPYYVVVLSAAAFAVVLAAQLAASRYVTWIYWLAVVMVSVFGTMAADVTHIEFGVPYYQSTAFFAVMLAVIFAWWHASERTLSIHSIYTRRRELFYWATVLVTFALGTAAGDMTARTLRLGWFSSGVLFAFVIAVPAIAHWKLGMNPVLAFWFAYVVTRPLGASFADWLGIAHRYGGLGYGYGLVSSCLTVLIAALVGYLAVTGRDVQERAAVPSGRRGRHRAQPVAGPGVHEQPVPQRAVMPMLAQQAQPQVVRRQRPDDWREGGVS
jgi:uncharacterized membrane-anchored protein